jgi:hypothetical protein
MDNSQFGEKGEMGVYGKCGVDAGGMIEQTISRIRLYEGIEE